jgi:putative transposase
LRREPDFHRFSGTVSIPKIGKVRAVIHRPLEGTVKSATVKQDSDGNWYITFVCHVELADAVPTFHNPVGIDVGLESFITLDNGEKIEPPKFFRKGQKKLKKLQQAVSRCPKGSQNRKKAKAKVAKEHCKTRNKRNDFLHKLSKSLVEQYDTFCIEDLNLKGLTKTKLAKSFSDAALGTFLRMLEYKAQWEGKTVIKVGRFFASSKTCHACGYKQSLELSDRKWVCDSCGVIHDRDINASKNILSEGLRLVASGTADTQNAFGGDVRLATASCRQ